MIKLIKYVYDEDGLKLWVLEVISVFTFCAIMFLTTASILYMNTHETVNQCHVQENNTADFKKTMRPQQQEDN